MLPICYPILNGKIFSLNKYLFHIKIHDSVNLFTISIMAMTNITDADCQDKGTG